MRFQALGDTAFLITLPGVVDAAMLARVRALAARLAAARPEGVLDIVCAYSSVAVIYEPERVRCGVGELPWHAVSRWLDSHLRGSAGIGKATAPRRHLIPVCYGGENGPDLENVARATGLSADEVVSLHSGASYTVAAVGFIPGFPYLLGLPERLRVARRATPRVRVPAGSVGLGGAQTGIYPSETPGGWQLIGRTDRDLFDPLQDPPARLAAADRVEFRPVSKLSASTVRALGSGAVAGSRPDAEHASIGPDLDSQDTGFVEVLRAGALTTVQDLGRVGLAGQGVGRGGALDPWAALAANLVLGNEPGAPLLECTYVGPVLRFSAPTQVALFGAELPGLPLGRPLRLSAGQDLDCRLFERGARLYIAVEGGLLVPRVLGSAATHLRAGFGGLAGRALSRGDRVGYRAGGRAQNDGEAGIDASPRWRVDAPVRPAGRGEAVVVRLVPGLDWAAFFPPSSSAGDVENRLAEFRFRLSAKSDRMGLRLEGDSFAAPPGAGEAVSRPVVPGTVQIPPDGRPIVLMAEGQTIGGYPQLGQVASIDLPKLAQARPGAEIIFQTISLSAAQQARLRVTGDLQRLRVGLEFKR